MQRNKTGQIRQVRLLTLRMLHFGIVLPILGVKEKGSDEVVVCGILFKSMKLKPQILDKYLANRSKEKELQNNKNRVADDDELFLEDEGTRTRLTGDTLRISRFVSGETQS